MASPSFPFLQTDAVASFPGHWDREMRLVALCARPSLGPDHVQALRSLADRELDWERVFERARIHGVLGMVYHHLAVHTPSGIVCPRLPAVESIRWCLQVENLQALQETARLAGLFSEAGIPLLTFKGPLLAAREYGNVAFRQFGDVDLMVRRPDLLAAEALLEAHGYETIEALSSTERKRHHDAQLGLEFVHQQTGVVVELHWALLNRTFSFRLDPAAVWARAQSMSLGEATIHRLAPDDQLIYLCAHGAKHYWSRLLCACDVRQAIDAHPQFDADRLVAYARRTGSLRTLALGVTLTERWLGASVPPAFHSAIDADPTIDRLVEEIEHRWFGRKAGIRPSVTPATLWFALRTRERFRDNIGMIAHYLTLAVTPTKKDRAVLPIQLPDALRRGLSYGVRPVRLVIEGVNDGIQSLRRRTEPGETPSESRRSEPPANLTPLQKLCQCSWAERRDLALAFAAAGIVFGVLRTCSFRRVLRFIDRYVAARAEEGLDEEAERRLLWAVEAATRRVLPRRPCLTQALVARLLLARRGAQPTTLHLGVARRLDGTLGAHAWLERNGAVLIGGDASTATYSVLRPDPHPAASSLRPPDRTEA